MTTLTYISGRVVEVPPMPDPAKLTQAERDAHARIYAETGSPTARRMAGIEDED